MIGIRGFGVHVPRYRLSAATLAAAWGGSGGGERAVANHDEDSLTMAVEASLAALAGRDGRTLGGVILASTTPPYAEKSSAAILATVADCGRDVFVADLGGSLRAGTTGLRLALDAVRAGSAREVCWSRRPTCAPRRRAGTWSPSSATARRRWWWARATGSWRASRAPTP